VPFVRLSVCMITDDPGPMVVAALAPLRELADEVVIAADRRVGAADLGWYASVADELVRIEVVSPERARAWLTSRCRGDWVMHLDGDEVPSAALVRALPDVLARRDIVQARVPRRWLFPDTGRWLEQLPWWPDFQVRLMRNDGGVRFSGRGHEGATPEAPALWLEAPLYHLDLVVTSAEERAVKAARRLRQEPGAMAPGGGELPVTLYLPERIADAVLRPVPDEDRAIIGAALAPSTPAPPPVDPASVPELTITDTDPYWGGREFGERAYRAHLEPFERDHRFAPGESRAVHVSVSNDGDQRWEWDGELPPHVRLGYRWRSADGELDLGEGPRSKLPHTLVPGATAIAAVTVHAPEREGRYRLEIDIVQEGVRWFGRPLMVMATVERPRGRR
jgi:hypothetical protein